MKESSELRLQLLDIRGISTALSALFCCLEAERFLYSGSLRCDSLTASDVDEGVDQFYALELSWVDVVPVSDVMVRSFVEHEPHILSRVQGLE